MPRLASLSAQVAGFGLLQGGVEGPGQGCPGDGPRALVGVIMGSDSDLPTMKAAADILEQFGVPYELTIVSAHRTPDRMVAYARVSEAGSPPRLRSRRVTPSPVRRGGMCGAGVSRDARGRRLSIRSTRERIPPPEPAAT